MTEKDLIPIEQKEVTFYDDEQTAIRADDGQVYVSIRHMCDALGIQRPQRQKDRIKRDEVLSDGLQRVPIMGTRGRQKTYVLRVDLVPLWLTGLETNRIGDEVQDKIIRYKREAAKVLRIEATLGDTGKNVTPDQASQISQAVKAMAMVLTKRSGRNEYGGVYGELYRREGITGYKLLPAHRFDKVMKWLSDWYQEITGDADVPF
jgi:hypothetical protein